MTEVWDIEGDKLVERNRSGEDSKVVSETKSGFQCTDFLMLPVDSVRFTVPPGPRDSDSCPDCAALTATPALPSLLALGAESFGSNLLSGSGTLVWSVRSDSVFGCSMEGKKLGSSSSDWRRVRRRVRVQRCVTFSDRTMKNKKPPFRIFRIGEAFELVKKERRIMICTKNESLTFFSANKMGARLKSFHDSALRRSQPLNWEIN